MEAINANSDSCADVKAQGTDVGKLVLFTWIACEVGAAILSGVLMYAGYQGWF